MGKNNKDTGSGQTPTKNKATNKIKEEKTKDEATEKPLESDENELDMINFLASDSFNQFVDEAKKVTNEKENDPRAPNKKRKIRKTANALVQLR